MSICLVDTHAHLTDKKYQEDISAVLNRARNAGVKRIINAGYDIASSKAVVELAETHGDLYAVVGIQPHDAPQALGEELAKIRSLLKSPRVVGVGEIGLDYYWNTWPKDVQIKAFRTQVELAKEMNLPFVVHDRDAHGDILMVLKDCAPFPEGFAMHCFSGSPEFALECIDLNGYISLAGPVTFKNAAKTVRVAKEIPLERMLLETDAPYLSPHPFRGTVNEPARLSYIADTVAELRGLDLDAVALATTANAVRLFSLDGGHNE